jgi:hypothetical protein
MNDEAMETIDHSDAIRLADEQIALHGGAIISHLSRYDADCALRTWHGVIRDIEEFINVALFGDIDDDELHRLSRLPIGQGLLDKIAQPVWREIC